MSDQEKDPQLLPVKGMYENWFLEYASYVILERAVPALADGLKPVQRRILHAMHVVDDGRYNKVANLIGQTMQYHPHGDAAIGDALVNLGQKDLLIDTQGNWGDHRTGDGAAAARYIEARLSPLAKEILFNDPITAWQRSYDGRKKEPITLPVKFPLLLAQGVEGIAVGLATKILPHNFCELLQGAIKVLQGKKPQLEPDFPTGGMADCTAYNAGKRGGKVRIRACIDIKDKNTLLIKEIPYGTTTTSLIDSILRANQKGKVKVKSVVDNTAEHVEIAIQLPSGQSPTVTIDALYVFTDCEVSISPNACVIKDNKPVFLGVDELLTASTLRTRDLLHQELELQAANLKEKILFASLEQIFIENRIYNAIEACSTWEAVLKTIDKGLEPHKKTFYRTLTEDDLVRLTEIKIKRISRFNADKAKEKLVALQEELRQVEHNLANLTDYAIAYFKGLLKRYGDYYPRQTELTSFGTLQAQAVAISNQKLYVNRKDGFIGYGLKKDELVTECSDLDDILVFRRDGTYLITRAAEKTFVGKGIEHVSVFKKDDVRRVFNAAYLDGKTGHTLVKRFQIKGVTRNKEYTLTQGNPNSRLVYFTDNHNGEAELVTVLLSQGAKARKKVFDFNFAELDIKGRTSKGNILTKYSLKKVRFKAAGGSTLAGITLWYDPTTGHLGTNEQGRPVGELRGDDHLLVILHSGQYMLVPYQPGQRYDPTTVALVEKFVPEKAITVVYHDGLTQKTMVKRFHLATSTLDKPFAFLTDSPATRLLAVTTAADPQFEVTYRTSPRAAKQTLPYKGEQAPVQGWKSRGVLLTSHIVVAVGVLD